MTVAHNGRFYAERKGFEWKERISELRNRGLSFREIAQGENVSVAAVHRALRPAANLEQHLDERTKGLEEHISTLGVQVAATKDFMEVVTKCARFSPQLSDTYSLQSPAEGSTIGIFVSRTQQRHDEEVVSRGLAEWVQARYETRLNHSNPTGVSYYPLST